MSNAAYNAVVIGAGIVGAACADRLSQDGLRVAIVEGDLVGGGATAEGMGHLVVMDDSADQFALTRYSQQLWAELQPHLPDDVEYRQTGTLWIAADEAEMAEVLRKYQFYLERGVPVEVISSSELAKLEPNLRSGLSGALLVREDAVLYPPCAARFFLERARSRNAEFHRGVPVDRIEGDSVVLRDGTHLKARWIINAAGIAATRLTPGLAIEPRKGHLVITNRYEGFVRHQLVELGYLKSAHRSSGDSVAFNVQPRATGQLLIGSSRQYAGTDRSVDAAIVSRMLRRALEFIPALANTAAIRTWTGFRAATADKLPLIGPWPEKEHLILAAGHEGLGITTSLATAALIADQISGRTSAIAPEPYLPARQLAHQTYV